MKAIGMRELKHLIDNGHVVHLYPRKLQVCINGFKYRKVNKRTADWLHKYTINLKE